MYDAGVDDLREGCFLLLQSTTFGSYGQRRRKSACLMSRVWNIVIAPAMGL
jgi:hypothetical protein